MTSTRSGALIVEHDVEMSLRDGTRLYADVCRPAEGRHPVLLQRTPYGKETVVGTLVMLNTLRAARAGYAVVIQDVRGRGRSDGDYVPFVNEGHDGYDAVEWAAAQDWCDGQVGMYGSSYMAATQLQAALAQPPSLRAICPTQASSDYYEGRSYKGGVFEAGALASISLFTMGAGSLARLALPRPERSALWNEAKAMLNDLPATVRSLAARETLEHTALARLAPFFLDWLAHDERDTFWESISVSGNYERIGVPALHISSWYDQFLSGALENYLGIRAHAQSDEVRDGQYLLIGPWSHYPARTALGGAVRVGEIDFGLGALVDLDGVQLAWFDRWLKSDDTAWRSRARVRLFVMGTNTWQDEPDWPLARTKSVPLFLGGPAEGEPLHGGGTLTWAETSRAGCDSFEFHADDPAPTTGGAHLVIESTYPNGPLDQRPIEARPDVRTYSTEPLPDPVTTTGEVSATLWIRSSAPVTQIVVRLTDVHPDGRSLTVCEGICQRTAEPDRVGRVVIELGATAHVFRAGHRVRVAVTASNFPRYPTISSAAGESVIIAVLYDEEHQSAVTVPLVN